MKILTLVACFILYINQASSQNKQTNSSNTFFDEKEATQQAISKGIKSSEIKGYVQFLKNDFSSKKALEKQTHKHSPYEKNKEILERVIYLNPNKTANAGCPNMSFEQNNFSGWTGSYGTVSMGATGSGSSIYSQTAPLIINTAGNNVSLVNSINYHTIVNTPPLSPIYPNCVGYDSIACKVVGTNTISQIPVVSPFSSDGSSVRMNGANANFRACKLKYVTTTSSTNTKLNYSFAFVLYDGYHLPEESPYFKVEIKNESTGNLLSVCNQSLTFQFPQQASDSIFLSANSMGGDFKYRKWQNYFVDLSSLPLGTNISVNFEVGGCAQGGHWGYAYVDAECGANVNGGGTNYITSNMCSGSNSATLMAPLGYSLYQWLNPSNNPISGATSSSFVVSNPTIGDIYSVQLTSSNGCMETKTVAIANSSITIANISAVGSCLNGNSGSTNVNAIGSNGTYSYTWTNISTGNVVSNSQTAINLNPGNYSVSVNSGTCGQSTATVNVPNSAPIYYQQYKAFCGNNTFISNNNGTNIQWYYGSTIVPGPDGNKDTLYISNPMDNDNYTVVYTNAGNCKDSIKYILTQLAGGYVSTNGITNACSNATNGSVTLNLTPVNSTPYTYTIKDISGTILNSITSSTLFPVNNLAAGSYTGVITDGNCIYSNTFTISVIQTNFTMTPSANNSCSPADTARINFNFGNDVPANCGLSSNGGCTSPNSIQIGADTTYNAVTNYPAIYSNWYKNARHQILYTAAELSAGGLMPGKISSLAFNIKAVAGTTVYPDFTIKMKCTSQQDLTSPAFDNNGLTQVYYSTSQSIGTGWNIYNFPTAYEWDGVSNILVDICTSLTSNYSLNSSMFYTTTPFVSVRWLSSDATIACMTTNASNVYSPNNTYRPNIQFGNCGSPSASSYSISVSSNGIITHNYNNDSIKVVPTITPTADIVYTITVTNPQGGCTSSQTFTMAANIAAVSSVTNASCGTCTNGAIQVVPSCGVAPYNYVWSPGGQTTAYISSLLPGCYTVTITDADANMTTEEICVTFATKLDESSIINGLSIFPNPSNGQFNLLSEIVLDKIDITLFNPLGQTIIEETIKNTKQATIDISKLSKGIYYLKASNDNSSKLFKLILE